MDANLDEKPLCTPERHTCEMPDAKPGPCQCGEWLMDECDATDSTHPWTWMFDFSNNTMERNRG